MNKTALIVIVVTIVVAGVIYAFVAMPDKGKAMPQPSATLVQNNEVQVSPTPTPPGSSPSATPKETPVAQPVVKEFDLTASNFQFSITEIEVKKGDRVRIVLENRSGTHDWRLDEFNVKTKILSSGQTDTVEFTADKTGTFEYYCSVGSHRQMGMRGQLIVK